jgi:hypothetical protein
MMAVDSTQNFATSDSPVIYEVQYPESLSRLLIFVKWLLVIPHLIILYALGIAASIVWVISFFMILFTGKYPEGMFKFMVGFFRWSANVTAYVGLLRDEYPPFSLDAGLYPVTVDIAYPTSLNRWLVLIKWLLVIPNLIVLMFVLLAAYIVEFIAWFAILFTGKFPEGMFKFVVGAFRWNQRLNAYSYFMRDEYPPFSLN